MKGTARYGDFFSCPSALGDSQSAGPSAVPGLAVPGLAVPGLAVPGLAVPGSLTPFGNCVCHRSLPVLEALRVSLAFICLAKAAIN